MADAGGIPRFLLAGIAVSGGITAGRYSSYQ